MSRRRSRSKKSKPTGEEYMILTRGVEGIIEARTLKFNNRIDEYIESIGGMIHDEFARRVIMDRVKNYKKPEKIEATDSLIAYKYYNPSRDRYGAVIGIMKVSKDILNELEKLSLPDDIKEIAVVTYSKANKKNLENLKAALDSRYSHVKMRTIFHGGEYPMFNLMRHVRVPLHVVLKEDEKYEIIRKYEVPEDELVRFPIIKASDPVAKLIGAKGGDLILILRDSETAGQAIYFRYVPKLGEMEGSRYSKIEYPPAYFNECGSKGVR